MLNKPDFIGYKQTTLSLHIHVAYVQGVIFGEVVSILNQYLLTEGAGEKIGSQVPNTVFWFLNIILVN